MHAIRMRKPLPPTDHHETIAKPRRARQRQLVGEICERLAGDLGEDVSALRRLVDSQPAPGSQRVVATERKSRST